MSTGQDLNSLLLAEMSYSNSSHRHQETGSEVDKFYKILVELYNNVQLLREIYIYFGTFITILGSILNTLCIFIFYKSKIFRNSSFPYYVYIISVIDTINIFLRFAVPQLIEKIIRNTLYSSYNVTANEMNQEKYDTYTNKITSDYHCGVFLYVYNSFTIISVWLMVAVSLERLLVIKFTLQTKYMIKLRAFLILSFIFMSVFTLNIFDLAPGLYIKPQWYANLTLLCERDDPEDRYTNSSRMYKRIGSFTFNSDHFALARTLLQSIIPFLFVLIFNSLIIHNFKRIKLAARGRGKSNSMASVNSFSGNCSLTNSRVTRSMKTRRQKNLNQNRFQLQIPGRSPDFSISSRSPSPNMSAPNTPVTPTSLVSALNLVPAKSTFLMPPDHQNGTMTPTSTNSSANLSVATTTNLTSSTCVNQQSSSDKLSFMITSVLPNKKNVATTTTTTSTRVSFKRRVNKIRLNRETDIMLIVLSFSILLSQLPCTIAWYLIYYRNIFKNMYNDITSIYFNAKTPMLLYIIRLLEMCYFSLNFVFYITLSPSLRRELRKTLPKKILYITSLFTKSFTFINKTDTISDNTDSNVKKNFEKPQMDIYGDYLSKIRSVSPVQRPSFLNTKNKKLCKKKFDLEPKTTTNNKIKIIIDNMYDEEDECKVEDLIVIDNNGNSYLDNRKRMFNFSSPSYLNSLDKRDNDKVQVEKIT